MLGTPYVERVGGGGIPLPLPLAARWPVGDVHLVQYCWNVHNRSHFTWHRPTHGLYRAYKAMARNDACGILEEVRLLSALPFV